MIQGHSSGSGRGNDQAPFPFTCATSQQPEIAPSPIAPSKITQQIRISQRQRRAKACALTQVLESYRCAFTPSIRECSKYDRDLRCHRWSNPQTRAWAPTAAYCGESRDPPEGFAHHSRGGGHAMQLDAQGRGPNHSRYRGRPRGMGSQVGWNGGVTAEDAERLEGPDWVISAQFITA
jgi:hypothetical protein